MNYVTQRRFWVAGLLVGLGWGWFADTALAAVGRTEAAYGVTANGAVAYTIPIRVTEGVAGLTPRLAISYAGPGQRSIVGVGFALSGLSYITPCRKTIVQDLNAAPVTLTSADRYCLDGARLRLATGTTYGASGTTYRTELDQLARVTANASTGNIPGWFKVETRDGLIYEYGNTADSKLLASGVAGAPPQFWAVNKIADRAGNSMSLVYDTDNALRRFRPSYLLYTAGNGGAAHYKISFVYQTATQPEPTLDFTPSATGGAAHSDDKLLDRIELSHDSVVYRKVLFTYEAGAGTNQRLKTVQECVPGVPDDCLPATTLGWQSATAGHAVGVSSNAVASGVIPLDINGDGLEDLAWASGGTWRYMLGGASGYGTTINTGVTATNATKAMPLEWDGDGFWDLLIDWSDGKWRVLKGSATGLSTSPVPAGPGTGIPSNTAGTTWTVADVDSDGRDDLVSMQLSAALAINVRFNSATGFGASTQVYFDAEIHTLAKGFIKLSGASAIRRPDFNGDARTDLLVYGCIWEPEPPGWCITNRWFQLLSNGSSYVNEGPILSAAYNIDVRYGDFNADGLTDIVYPATTAKWNLGFGQGSGGLSIVAGPSSTGYATYQTLTGDHDGDGYDDFYATTNSPWQWNVFRSVGSALASTAIATGLSADGLGWMLTDQNGDSLPDLGRYDSTSLIWSSFAHLGLPGERLLTGADGLGNGVTFTYLPMTDGSVYTKGISAFYPDRDYRSAAPLVRTMQVAPAGGTSFTLTYQYAGARVHAQGRSFLGMGSRTVTDSRNGVLTTETYRQDFPYIGAPATVTVKQSGGVQTIQSVTHSCANHLLDATSGNQRYLPYRSQTLTQVREVGGVKNGLLITEVTENHTVNTLGNTTFATLAIDDEDLSSPEVGSSWRTEVTATYSEDQTNWCVAVPTSRSDKRILPGGTFATRTTNWAVAGVQCRVTQETLEAGAGSALSLVTDLGYDTCGNLSQVTTAPAGTTGQERVTALNYGARCQRPESITNALGQISTIAYNWPLALPSTRKRIRTGSPRPWNTTVLGA